MNNAACLTGPIKGCHCLKFMYKCASKKESKSVPDSIVIQPQGTKALAVPLVTNLNIVRLNLRDNWMEAPGGSAVAELLKENCYITGASLPFAVGAATYATHPYAGPEVPTAPVPSDTTSLISHLLQNKR